MKQYKTLYKLSGRDWLLHEVKCASDQITYFLIKVDYQKVEIKICEIIDIDSFKHLLGVAGIEFQDNYYLTLGDFLSRFAMPSSEDYLEPFGYDKNEIKYMEEKDIPEELKEKDGKLYTFMPVDDRSMLEREKKAMEKVITGQWKISNGIFEYELYDEDQDEELYIPYGVTEIAGGAFVSCNYRYVEVPYGVKKIGKNAFGSSRGIEEVKLNEDLEIIEKEAFLGCFCLSKINMPVSVLVGEDAFKQCLIR